MTYLDYLEQKVLLERLVIGLEEPVLIKGLGELSAKIDSGNGGYNVIHGTDFHQQGDELMFTTHDSFGHEKKIQAKVIDTIEINMGGGNIENRPVIELDIKFAGEDYKKIPFSVSDRSSNSNPILISKGFVENELEALIDVGAMNISHEGRDVVYGESVTKRDVLDAIGKVSSAGHKAASSLTKGVWDAGKSIGKGALGTLKTFGKGIANAGDWMQGGDDVSLLSPLKGAASMGKDIISGTAGAISGVTNAVTGALSALGGAAALEKISKWAKNIGNHDKFLSDDKHKIITTLPSCPFVKKLSENNQVDVSRTILETMSTGKFAGWEVFPVCNYLCEKGDGEIIKGLEERRKQYKKLINKAKEAVSDLREKSSSDEKNQMGESFSLLEASVLLEQDDTNDQYQQDNNQPTNKNTTQQDHEDYQEITTTLEQLQNFTLWFIPFGKQYNTQNKLAMNSKRYMRDFFATDDATLIKMFNSGSVSMSSTKHIIREIASDLNKKTTQLETSNEYQGFFAIVIGEQREVQFYESLDCTAYAKSSKVIEDEQKQKKNQEIKNAIIDRINEIGNLNRKFNIRAIDIAEPEQSDYSDILSIVSKNYANMFAQSAKLIAFAKKYDNDKEKRNQVIEKLNLTLEKEYPLYLLQNSKLGNQILKVLGHDYRWNGYDDFISKCSNNEDIRNLLFDNKEEKTSDVNENQDDDPDSEWYSYNDTVESEEEPVQEQEEDKWINEKISLLKLKGIM